VTWAEKNENNGVLHKRSGPAAVDWEKRGGNIPVDNRKQA